MSGLTDIEVTEYVKAKHLGRQVLSIGDHVMRTPSPKFLALCFAFLAVAAGSTAFIGVSFALRLIPPGPLMLMRFVVASACFGGLLLLGMVKLPARRDLPPLVLISLLGHAVYQLALSVAQTRITAGMAGVLIGLVPAMSALLAWSVLGERLSRRGWMGIAVAFGGVVLISLEKGSIGFDPMALLALVAAAASAGYFILQKPWLLRYTALDLAAYGIWSATAAMLVFAPAVPGAFASATTATLLTVAYLGIVPTAFGYTMWGLALACAPASEVASLLYVGPVVTFLLAWAILSEVPTPAILLGAACALGGVGLVNSGRTVRAAGG